MLAALDASRVAGETTRWPKGLVGALDLGEGLNPERLMLEGASEGNSFPPAGCPVSSGGPRQGDLHRLSCYTDGSSRGFP